MSSNTRWKIRVWDGNSTIEYYGSGSYEYATARCRAYPPSYIWTAEPA